MAIAVILRGMAAYHAVIIVIESKEEKRRDDVSMLHCTNCYRENADPATLSCCLINMYININKLIYYRRLPLCNVRGSPDRTGYINTEKIKNPKKVYAKNS